MAHTENMNLSREDNMEESTMDRQAEVVAVMRMGEANTYYHLKPISMCPNVSSLHLVRPLPSIQRGEIKKLRYYEISGKTIIQRLWHVYQKAVKLGMRPQVKAFVSFYAFPYGFIAFLAGKRTGKPVHIGFVGSDWNRNCHAWYGHILDRLLRKARLITVPGPTMKKEMLARHYPPEKIFLLPHAIDVDEYIDVSPEKRKYDCIFVGYLLPVKRVDIIISAIGIVKRVYPQISLCIVGDGPLRSGLESQTKELRLEQNISFVGFQQQPARWFSDARIVLIASDMEGFPFTLVEGMVAGAVPVSTTVGTIPDFIEHGKTGLLVPPGDSNALAESIACLMDDKQLYDRIRDAVLEKRKEFRFENVANLWSNWITMMCS